MSFLSSITGGYFSSNSQNIQNQNNTPSSSPSPAEVSSAKVSETATPAIESQAKTKIERETVQKSREVSATSSASATQPLASRRSIRSTIGGALYWTGATTYSAVANTLWAVSHPISATSSIRQTFRGETDRKLTREELLSVNPLTFGQVIHETNAIEKIDGEARRVLTKNILLQDISRFIANLEKDGSLRTMTIKGKELPFFSQILRDYNRGKEGTQDLFIQGRKKREKFDHHLKCLPEILEKFYNVGGEDPEKVYSISLFANQLPLNIIQYFFQEEMMKKLNYFTIMTDTKISWSVHTAPSVTRRGSNSLYVTGQIFGNVLGEIDREVLPNLGIAQGSVTFNVTEGFIEASYKTMLKVNPRE